MCALQKLVLLRGPNLAVSLLASRRATQSLLWEHNLQQQALRAVSLPAQQTTETFMSSLTKTFALPKPVTTNGKHWDALLPVTQLPQPFHRLENKLRPQIMKNVPLRALPRIKTL